MTTQISPRDQKALLPYQEFDELGRYSRLRVRSLVRLLKYLMSERQDFFKAVGFMFVAILTSLLAPYLLGQFVDRVLVKHVRSLIPLFVALWILTEAVRLLCSVFENYFFSRVGQSVLHKLRLELFSHILCLPLARLAENSSGSLVSRILGDTNALSQMFTAGVIRIVEKFAVVFFIVISLLILNTNLALITLAFFPILIGVAFFISLLIYRGQRRARLIFSGLTAFIGETVAGKRVMASLDIGATLLKRFSYLNAELSRSQFIPAVLMGVFHGILSVLVGISVAALLIVGGGRVQRGEMAVGELVTFVTYLIWMFWPIMHMVNQWSTIITGLASAERLFEVLDWPQEAQIESTEEKEERRELGYISFKNVWFAYSPDKWVLKDVSFDIQRGQKIGMVGVTGSGKSTIISLLLRFYKPQRGVIYLEGVDINTIELEKLREAIGVVEQSGSLFEGSVAENLGVGDHERSGAQSSAADLIERTRPGLLERHVDSGGRNLSSGERQLVAFARILARDPSVWILDEATAHVDSELDRELNQLAMRYTSDRTLLVIAHRLSSVVDTDKIMVLRDGEIVEQGTHHELETADGVYARLWKAQFHLEAESAR